MQRLRVLLLVAAWMIPAAAGAAVPTASFTPSRSSGAAPLGVFFDASATTCSGCSGMVNAWHDLLYQWDFGDNKPDQWAHSGKSKNTDIGPSAAHVFETGGVFTVTLTVTDPATGDKSTPVTKQIQVANPDVQWTGSATYCFSSSGDFTDCPTGAVQKTSSNFVSALNTCVTTGNRRCLFRRGDTFTSSSAYAFTNSGPLLIGAFGPGTDKPLVKCSSSAFDGNNGGADYRVVELKLQGPANNTGDVVGGGFTQTNALFLRLEAVNGTWLHGYNLSGSALSYNKQTSLHTNVFIVENDIEGVGKGSGPLAGLVLHNSALLGNTFLNSTKAEHILRAYDYDGLLVAHNFFAGPALGKQLITLRSFDTAQGTSCGLCPPSRKAHVHSNLLSGGLTSQAVQLCNADAGTETPSCEDTIIDSNFSWLGDTYGMVDTPQVFYELTMNQPRRTTVRNNICDQTGLGGTCLHISGSGDLSRAYHNTCYRSDAKNLTCISGSSAGASAIARNNLLYAPGAGTTKVADGTWTTSDHNVLASSNPFVANPPGDTPTDYELTASNPGAKVADLLDFGGRTRTNFDVGAWEKVSTTTGTLSVTLAGPTGTVRAGDPIALSATVSNGTGPYHFDWDCDGDGSFETSGTAAPNQSCPGLPFGLYTLGVQVTDSGSSPAKLASDTAAVNVLAKCGNGVREGAEACDGNDLGGTACATLGFTGGALACKADCTFDTSGCTGPAGTCGDGHCAGDETAASCFADCGTLDSVGAYDSTINPEVQLYADWTGQDIDYGTMASPSLGVVAECAACGGVAFILDNLYTDPRTRRENIPPYSMGGDSNGWYFGIGCANGGPCTNPLALGHHTIDIWPCSADINQEPWANEQAMQAACNGTIGPVRTISFEVVDSAAADAGGSRDAAAAVGPDAQDLGIDAEVVELDAATGPGADAAQELADAGAGIADAGAAAGHDAGTTSVSAGKGCGCASSGSALPLLALALVAFARRRKRA